ncbi:MAG: glycosidase [Candidatus Brocadiaceae bacterium]|nr:glycosidase [Candidatus Brocadiaceae bacterium]
MAKFTWKGSPAIKRQGIVLDPEKDVPWPCHMAYNAGVVKFNGRYNMLFRNIFWNERYGKSTRRIGRAVSDDGIRWDVDPDFWFRPDGITNPEDPRMTVCDGRVYVTFTENCRDGIRGCIAVTDDFENYEILSMSAPDNRNMIVFPERRNGKFLRLERPFRAYGMRGEDRYDMWFSDSPDARYWGNTHLVLRANDLPYCNWKNGPSGQPIRTDKGWLVIFHATHYDPDTVYPTWRDENWHKVYCAGIMMLDLEEPWKIVGISQDPLMVPEEPYETDGFRSYTIFPSATLLEDDGTVRIYYGACDTVLALATAKLDDLIGLCKPL